MAAYNPSRNNPSRRGFLRLAGLGALAAATGPTLIGCGEGSSGSGVSNAGKELTPWPTYVKFEGPTPDSPATADGVQALYLNYPQNVTTSVTDQVGDGSDVTAIVTTFGTPPKVVGENQLWQAINKALGVNLKLITVPDQEYGQKLTTLMTGGDLPDIIMFNSLSLAHAQEFIQASCADLSDYVGGDAVRAYPNVANIPTYAWKGMGRIGGKIYGVPLERPTPGNVLFVNRTAMNSAGIPEQWTKDQFVSGMKQMTSAKSWGIGGSKSLFGGFSATSFHAASLGAPNMWAVADGKFANTITTPAFEEALGVMRSLAEAGCWHPESLTASSTEMKNYFYNGTIGAMSDGFGALATSTLTKINNRYALGIARPYGANPTPWRGAGTYGYVVFKKASAERIKLLMRIVNYLSSPFGTKEFELCNYGVEGTHFTKADGTIKTTDLYKVENSDNLPVRYLGVAPAVIHLPGYPEIAKAAYEWEKAVLPKSIANPAQGLRSATVTSKGAGLDQIIGDGIAAVVFGRKPASAWKDIVSQWRQDGGDQVAAELATEYAATK